MDINIIFEDKNIIVVEKPPKLACQNDKTNDESLLDILREKIKKENPNLKDVYLELVQRLDRPVGGLLVLAKTKESNSKLSRQVQNRQIKKDYLAVVCGEFLEEKGELRDFLKKNSTINMSRVVSPDAHGSKEALLLYEVLEKVHTEEYGTLSLVRVNLKTGRHHQIRVQLSNAGCPIWGDNKYNEAFARGRGWTQIALWSHQLSFRHPIKKANLSLTSMPYEEYPWNLFDIEIPEIKI